MFRYYNSKHNNCNLLTPPIKFGQQSKVFIQRELDPILLPLIVSDFPFHKGFSILKVSIGGIIYRQHCLTNLHYMRTLSTTCTVTYCHLINDLIVYDWMYIYIYIYIYILFLFVQLVLCIYIVVLYVIMYIYVILSHLRSKEITGIHKPCMPNSNDSSATTEYKPVCIQM